MKLAYSRGILATLNVSIQSYQGLSVFLDEERIVASSVIGPRRLSSHLKGFLIDNPTIDAKSICDELGEASRSIGESQPSLAAVVVEDHEANRSLYVFTFSISDGAKWERPDRSLTMEKVLTVDTASDGYSLSDTHIPGRELISPALHLLMQSALRPIRSAAVSLSVLDGASVRHHCALDAIEYLDGALLRFLSNTTPSLVHQEVD